MTIMKPAIAVAALLAFAACEQRSQGRYTSPGTSPTGDPGRPTANMPTGSSPAPATGGGVPTPTGRGGTGGVGSGNQPGLGGSGSGR